MIKLMRPVIDFLNRLAIERKNRDEDARILQSVVENAKHHEIADVKVSPSFKAPQVIPIIEKAPELSRISYLRPKKEIQRAKKILNVSTAPEVGQKTFEYFYKRECQE